MSSLAQETSVRAGEAARVEPIPNFFIVGAPKCATTSMDNYLAEHPQIYMSPAKETHYFARDLYPPGIACSSENYFGQFRATEDESIVGESSVFYMLSKTAARHIFEFQPRAKLLFMLRNPVDLLASHHAQILYEGLETESDFARALALEQGRRETEGNEIGDIRRRVLRYRELVQFDKQIARFLEVFPRDQMHFVLYDDVRKHLGEVYAGILRFLGVQDSFQPEFPVHNARKVARSRSFGNFIRRTPGWVTMLARTVMPDSSARTRLRDRLIEMNQKRVPQAPIDAALRGRLVEELTPCIERMESILGRDLSAWRAVI